MDIWAFQRTLSDDLPPQGLGNLLLALWYDGKGDWTRSHEIAQALHTPEGAWVHAYLHRKEGDTWNAEYWYRQSGRQMPAQSLQAEWENLVITFLASR